MTKNNQINTPEPFTLASGGTGASLVASNGGIFYSTATNAAILLGTATAQQLLLSGANSTPTWSTTTYPLTNPVNTLLYASSINVMSALATANNGVLVTSAGGVPSISTTLPNGLAMGTPLTLTLTNATGLTLATGVTGTLPVANGGTNNTTFTPYAVLCAGTTATGAFQNVSGVGTSGQVLTSTGAGALPTWQNVGPIALPSGTLFNLQQGVLTTPATTVSGSYVDTGITVTITPTSAANSVLVRAVVQLSTSLAANAVVQLVRGSTPIGIGTSVGSRTAAGAQAYSPISSTLPATTVMEWLDTPATTSATTYKVQYAMFAGSGGISINASNTDTNSGGFARTASTITVMEVKS